MKIHSKKNAKFLPFEEARKFAQSLKLQTRNEWREWAKNDEKPFNIPSTPDRNYRNKGWNGWGDWLGTGTIASQQLEFLPFVEAREYVHSLKLKGEKDWHMWAKSTERPSHIPAGPAQIYKNQGWSGWGDWFGTGTIANQKKQFLPFDEARQYVHTLNLNAQKDWVSWAKSSDRPLNIPASPVKTYKNKGWKSWGDWLGSDTIATQSREFLIFEQARQYVHTLKIKGQREWRDWVNSSNKPQNIPYNPDRVYIDQGWLGWNDWLGIYTYWNKYSVLSFLKSLEPIIPTLTAIELFTIIRQNGMLSALSRETKTSDILQSIRDLCSSENRQNSFKKLISQIETACPKDDLYGMHADIEIPENISIESINIDDDLPILNEEIGLNDIDHLAESGLISDDETIEFLISNRVSRYWQKILDGESQANISKLRHEEGGTYFRAIKARFFSQYDGALSLIIPNGYSFTKDGIPKEPNLMQRLTAYRVMTDKRVGNWSGVGAGKTISAILSSRVIKAKLTVIIAFNSTIDGWERAIYEVFPKSKVHKKETGPISLDKTCANYILLNFEKFQQPNSVKFIKQLVHDHRLDFVVLDEIQNVKQRKPNEESLRRKLVKLLLVQATDKNSDLHVLGMSATPVINNLYEGKALLELVKGVEFYELKTASTVANASALHEKLILHGIRYRPRYSQKTVTQYPMIDGQGLVPRLLQVSREGILELELALLEAKLDCILQLIQPGTLVYSHYKTKILHRLSDALQRSGFSIGFFTGDDKEGLNSFLSKKIDVLIGTSPISTGVDGLQFVCNRLVIVCLPWTAAEYEQLIGRLYRQGSNFDVVEIFIPQVVLNHNGIEWSWDKSRMRRIEFKKTLADTALDGVIPEGNLESAASMLDNARKGLQAWISRVEKNDLFAISREKLCVHLDDQDIIQGIRRFGDFSAMNARINASNSITTHDRFKTSPAEWYLYHSLYRKARKCWSEIPYERIGETLKKRPDWIIGDFGCGEAKLAEILSNKIYSFDHVAINEGVIPCDLRKVPVGDGILDIAVFSLSLMGLNYTEYLKEAHRTLRFGGMLKIAEPSGRWSNSLNELVQNIRTAGFQILGDPARSEQFIYINAIKL